MEYEQFKKILESTLAIEDELEQLGEALKGFFDSHIVCTIGGRAIATTMDEIEKTVAGKSDGQWIQWWVYETDRGKNNFAVFENGEQTDIRTIEDLYKFLVEIKKWQMKNI